MRILIVSQYFWPENFGINALAKALVRRGVEVEVLTGKPNYPEGVVLPGYRASGTQSELWGGLMVHRVPLYPRGRQSALRLVLNYLSFIASGFLFGPKMLRERNFDVVLVYAPSPLLQALPALYLARAKAVPCALWVQDLWPESLAATGFVRNHLALKIVEHVIRFIYRHTDQVLIPSLAFRAPIERLGVAPDRITYYPNAYVEEPTESVPDDAQECLAKEIAEGFSVVFAGNLGTAQALETVVDAATVLQKQNVPVRLFLIGSGSRLAWVEQEVAGRGLRNIRLPGRFSPQAIPRFYAAASALLVTLRDEPIFALTIPSKVQSYLAAGRPIVASLNGEGARLIAEIGAGLVCPAGDSEALAAAIANMVSIDADERKKMGSTAQRYAAENFSLDSLADALIGQLEQVVAAYSGRSI